MKTTNTFSVQFVIRTKKSNPREAIIYARINVNKKRLEISLKKSIDPWFVGQCGRMYKGEQARSKTAE